MKLSTALSILIPLKEGLKYAFMPFINDIWVQIKDRVWFKSPELRLRLTSFIELRRLFFAHLWKAFGSGSDENCQSIKQELLAPVQGAILDLGAGYGHTARYLPRHKVSRYLAVEPNKHMHSGLRDAAHKAGFLESDGSFVLLSCGAEDTRTIMESTLDSSVPLSKAGTVDSIVCVLTLCSIPNAEKAVTRIVQDLLRPGGTLFLFEHVRNKHADVAWWQTLWSPVWSVFFDGCRLDCATDQWIEKMKDIDDLGREMAMWKKSDFKYATQDEMEDNLMPHILGTFVKHD